jgi:hypothetical protein
LTTTSLDTRLSEIFDIKLILTVTIIVFRSEIMRLYQLTVPKDDAWNVMNEFGDVGLAHFIDLNKEESPYTLPYTTQIK